MKSHEHGAMTKIYRWWIPVGPTFASSHDHLSQAVLKWRGGKAALRVKISTGFAFTKIPTIIRLECNFTRINMAAQHCQLQLLKNHGHYTTSLTLVSKATDPWRSIDCTFVKLKIFRLIKLSICIWIISNSFPVSLCLANNKSQLTAMYLLLPLFNICPAHLIKEKQTVTETA